MENICKNIQEQIPDLLMGALSPEKITELQKHIDRCPSCSRYLQSLQADDKLLSNFAQSLQPVLAQLENNVINTLAQTKPVKPAKPVSIWRTIIKSPITKLAAAAMIILAVVLSITFMDRSISPAYALEQTMKAVNDIRYFHFKQFGNPPEKNLSKEAWVEYGPNGDLKNMRFDSYKKGKISFSVAWKEGKTEEWIRDQELRFYEDADYSAKILFFVSRYNPKGEMEFLDNREKEGKVKIQIEEPTDRRGDILTTAIFEPNTYALQRKMPAMKDIYHIDNASRLVKAVEIFQLDPNGPKPVAIWEYCDYNQPSAPDLFDLDKEAPSDVKRIDFMAMNTGIEQGNLSDSEIAKESVRQFLDALVNKDYALAGKLVSREMTEQQAIEQFGDFHILKVISIDEPKTNQYMDWIVTFKAEFEKNGRTTMDCKSFMVNKVIGHPTRWAVWVGPNKLK